MTSEQAQDAVSLSAFVVASIFAYRKLTSSTSSSAPNTSHFVIGFGFTFIILSLLAQAAPELGGMLAVLVATGDMLANGNALLGDVQTSLKQTATATKPAAAGA